MSSEERIFREAMNSFFRDYREGSFVQLRERMQNIRSLELPDSPRDPAYGAIAGMLDWRTGNVKSAQGRWESLLVSGKGSNAAKIIASAGMGMFYAQDDHEFELTAAVRAINALSVDCDANLWVAEALHRFLEVLAEEMELDFAQDIFEAAVAACGFIEKAEKDRGAKREAALIRADCCRVYAKPLVLIGRLKEAEKLLTEQAVPIFGNMGKDVKVAECVGLLGRIKYYGGDHDRALYLAKEAWGMFKSDDPMSQLSLESAANVFQCYSTFGTVAELLTLDMFQESGLPDPRGYLETVLEWEADRKRCVIELDFDRKALEEPPEERPAQARE